MPKSNHPKWSYIYSRQSWLTLIIAWKFWEKQVNVSLPLWMKVTQSKSEPKFQLKIKNIVNENKPNNFSKICPLKEEIAYIVHAMVFSGGRDGGCRAAGCGCWMAAIACFRVLMFWDHLGLAHRMFWTLPILVFFLLFNPLLDSSPLPQLDVLLLSFFLIKLLLPSKKKTAYIVHNLAWLWKICHKYNYWVWCA